MATERLKRSPRRPGMDMLDRMASRMMVEEAWGKKGGSDRPWHDADASVRSLWRQRAISALEAMIQPTARMVEAGRREPVELRYGSSDCDVNPIRAHSNTELRYSAMILTELEDAHDAQWRNMMAD